MIVQYHALVFQDRYRSELHSPGHRIVHRMVDTLITSSEMQMVA